MIKTRYNSYSLKGMPEGCKRCLKGRKMVLFLTGKCSRNCIYCPLSSLRKNSNKIWANERECKKIKDVIEETKESNSDSCSITGGDPLLDLRKTLFYAKRLKKEFGKKFHIHIYLSTKLADDEKLRKLSKVIDEVRFHPEFLSDESKYGADLTKVKLASAYWKKKDIGLEMPIIPEKKNEILRFILALRNEISFVNLNELEIGDTNFEYISKNYKLDKEGYTVKDSIKCGKWILKEIEKRNLKIKVHLCTAETKNWHQYKNRLKRHKIMKFGKKTGDGTVVYFYTKRKNSEIKKKDYFYDKKKKRYILNPRMINKIKKLKNVYRSEEYPTYDRDEVELEVLKIKKENEN